MSSSALAQVARRALTQRAGAAPARAFQTSAPKRGGADEPAYIHAEKMYDVHATKGKHLIFGAVAAGMVLVGGYIPVFAIQFQQKKASG